MKKLLMLGTSYGTGLMLDYAKSQGVYTIVTDYLEPEHSPGKLMADGGKAPQVIVQTGESAPKDEPKKEEPESEA